MTERIPAPTLPNTGQVRTIQVPELPTTRVPQQRMPGLSVIRTLPRPVTQTIPKPVTTQLDPPAIPNPTLDIPDGIRVPQDKPLEAPEVVPPAAAAPNWNGGQGSQSEPDAGDTRDMPEAAAPQITLPIVGDIPIPPKETVILSGTTAVATVAATLIGKEVATALLKWMKPLVKQLYLKGKKLLKKDLTPYETQLLMAFESEKKLVKRLKAEAKAEKLRQASVHQAPPRQRIQMRMEKKDGSRPQP